MKLLEAQDEQILSARKKEFEVLQNLQHPNIVEAMEFLSSGSQAIVVLNFIEGSTLDVAIKTSESKCFSESVSRDLVQKLMRAVNYLHSRRVVHRDIKAQNVIVSHDQTDLHLLDFNTAKSLEDGGAYTMTGTLQYSSPEVLDGQPPGEKHDVWCTGLCLHIMMTGSLPHTFCFQSFDDFTQAVSKEPVNWQSPNWEFASESCKDVVSECLTVDMALRPALLLVLEMEWFDAPEKQQRTYTEFEDAETDVDLPMVARAKTWSSSSNELLFA